MEGEHIKSRGQRLEGGRMGLYRGGIISRTPLTSPLPIYEGVGEGSGSKGKVGGGQRRDQVLVQGITDMGEVEAMEKAWLGGR